MALAFSSGFLDELDRAVKARDGKPERDEVRFRCPNPDHEDKHPSARWNRKKAVWCCDACGAGGGALRLAELLGVAKPSSKKSPAPTHRSPREPVKHATPSDKSGTTAVLT
jgi:hypothetical protein